MPFIPHTEADVRDMLAAIGAPDIETLFDEIPQSLKVKSLAKVPEGLSEMDTVKLMRARAKQDEATLNFAGAGAYEHHIPAAIWQIVGRGEFYSAYTPYQAEASQGTLQLIYEYQTMMTRLTGMDVSNASMYDGATALAEAVLMAERSARKGPRKVLVPRGVHRRTARCSRRSCRCSRSRSSKSISAMTPGLLITAAEARCRRSGWRNRTSANSPRW